MIEATDTAPLPTSAAQPPRDEAVSAWLGTTATGEIRTRARRRTFRHPALRPAAAAASAVIGGLSIIVSMILLFGSPL